MRITTAKELIDAAKDPNVAPVNVSAALLEGSVELLESEALAAEKSLGKDLVSRLRSVRAISGRLSSVTTDGTEQAVVAQSDLAAIAAFNSDEHMLWLLASSIMTDEQMAFVRNAFK